MNKIKTKQSKQKVKFKKEITEQMTKSTAHNLMLKTIRGKDR